MLDKNMYHEVPEVVHRAVLSALDSIEENGVNEGSLSLEVGKENGEWESSFDSEVREDTRDASSKRDHARAIIYHIPRAGAACLVLCGLLAMMLGGVYVSKKYVEGKRTRVLEEYYAATQAGETTSFSRSYTSNEAERYAKIKKQLEEYGVVTESSYEWKVTSDQLEDVLQDIYDLDEIVLDTDRKILYLPERELTDEEILEIIEFSEQIHYMVSLKEDPGEGEAGSEEDGRTNSSGDIDIVVDERDSLDHYEIAEETVWGKRVEYMTNDEIELMYLTMFCASEPVSGAYSRPFSEKEKLLYQELKEDYEHSDEFQMLVTLQQTVGIPVFTTHGGFTESEEGISICVNNSIYYFSAREPAEEEMLKHIESDDGIGIYVYDSTFCFPERELTKKEMLALIDFEHRASYSIQRITWEVQTGIRTGYPYWETGS